MLSHPVKLRRTETAVSVPTRRKNLVFSIFWHRSGAWIGLLIIAGILPISYNYMLKQDNATMEYIERSSLLFKCYRNDEEYYDTI